MTNEDITKPERIVNKQKALPNDKLNEWPTPNREFHKTINMSYGNEPLTNLIQQHMDTIQALSERDGEKIS